MTKRMLIALCVCLCLSGQTKPPVINRQLQGEAKKLATQLKDLQTQFVAAKKQLDAKLAEMQKVCGAFEPTLDEKTMEYTCGNGPLSTRNASGTWRGVRK